MKANKKIISFLLTLVLLLPAGMPVFAADSDGDGYNDHDFSAIQAFLNQESATEGVTNGQAVNSGYNPDAPATWGSVEWSEDAEKRVTRIEWKGVNLAGNLDLSGCTSLVSLYCDENKIVSIDVAGCTSLLYLDFSENLVTSETFDFSGCTLLERLLCGDNLLTALELTGYTALLTLDCSNNQLTTATLDFSACASLKELYCSGNEITSLDVSVCTALEELYCSGNEITSLNVSACTALEYLYCSGNGLTSLNVSGCADLEELDCSDNLLTNALNLSEYMHLTNLYCNENDLASLDVSGCEELNDLNCGGNHLASLDVTGCTLLAILNCSGNLLTELAAGDCELEDIDTQDNPLTSLTVGLRDDYLISLAADGPGSVGLDYDVAGAKQAVATPDGGEFINWTDNADGDAVESTEATLTLDADTDYDLTAHFEPGAGADSYNDHDFSVIQDFLNLPSGTADLSNGQVMDSGYDEDDPGTWYNVSWSGDEKRVTGINWMGKNLAGSLDLSGCTSLTSLYCDQNAITSLDVSGCTSLTLLNCYSNQLTSASFVVTGCTSLEYLYCQNNLLTSLDLSGFTELKELQCNSNQLISLGLTGLTSLTYLSCYDNRLDELGVSGCTLLEYLDCSLNDLTELNVSGLASLTTIYGGSNELISLIITGCASITELNCSENKLTSLDVSGLTALNILYCGENDLTSLNVSGLTVLYSLNCDENELTELDVSDCASLNELSCSGNMFTELDVSYCALEEIEALDNPLTSLSVGITGGALISLAAEGPGTVGLAYDYDEEEGDRGAVATPGVSLINWTDNNAGDAVVSTEPIYELSAGTNYDLTAHFGADIDYSDHDVAAIQAFLSQDSGVAGQTNEEVLDYDADDPATWTGVEWGMVEGKARVTDIDWDYVGIAGGLDLSGCTALESLNCNGNGLASLDVSGCTALELLYCSANGLASLDVSDCTALVELTCSANGLTSLDLSGYTELESLSCNSSQLTSLTVSGCTALEYLSCSDNQLTSLVLSNCIRLGELNCDGNEITSLNVSGFTELGILYCFDNRLVSLGLSNCTALYELFCSGNLLTEFDAGDSLLENVEVLNNPLAQITAKISTDGIIALAVDGYGTIGLDYDVDALGGTRQAVATPGAGFLNWTDNAGGAVVSTEATLTLDADTDYDLTAHFGSDADGDGYNDHDYYTLKNFLNLPSAEADKTNGQVLNAAYDEDSPATWTGAAWSGGGEKRVTGIGWGSKDKLSGSLGLSGFAALETLDCGYNQLTSLDVSGCTALEELDCSYNALTSLNMTNCTLLKYLDCNFNNLASLSVSGFSALEELYCNTNVLTALDVSTCPALEYFDCFNNMLTSLNVSGCTALTELNCRGNQLASLNVAGFTALEYLNCSVNRLTSLNVSGCTALTDLDCSANQLASLDATAALLESVNALSNPLKQLAARMDGAAIELTARGNGTVGLSYSLLPMDVRQAVAAPDPGFGFINWTDDANTEASTAAAFNLDIDEDYDLTANFECSVIFDKNGGNAGPTPSAIVAAPGATITAPAIAPMRTDYTFSGWYKEATCTTAWNFDTDTVTANITLYAKWIYNGNDNNDNGGSRTSVTPPLQNYNATVSGGGTVPITVNAGAQSASLDLGELAGNLSGGGNTVVNVPSITGVNSFTANLPASSLSGSRQGSLTLNTPAGSLTIPGDMLSGTGLSGNAGITISEGDTSGLSDDVKDAIGDRPVIQLTLTVNGRQTDWDNPDAPVAVSIPYVPSAEELANPEGIVIWYIDGSGNAVSVPNGHYDPVTGTVAFEVTHFSGYAVAYNPVSFSDVPAGAWYSKAVAFIAARDITTGTGGDNFSPDMKLTRGQFLVMLMKAYELAPDSGLTDNFFDAGNTYYTGYLAAAKRLGISGGVGDNLFAPEKEITRQEMFTLLYNALKEIGKLPAGGTGKSLSSFSDAGQIASWATDAITALVETGAIAGSGGKLDPAGTTSRAEISQVLYNLLSK